MDKNNRETYWSQFSSKFEERQRYVTGQEVITAAMRELLEEQNLGSVLELGCGTGLYTESLIQVANNVLATDLSDEMIGAATQKRGSLDNVTFRKADALNLPFDQDRFDTVFMANLIHIIGDPEKVIEESRRVLKKGGWIIITSFAVDEMSFFNRIFTAIKYFKAFGKPSQESLKEKISKERIEELLLKNGFRISKSKVIGNKVKAIYLCGIKE